jgi:carbon monoxide dehydrogenase subunit G
VDDTHWNARVKQKVGPVSVGFDCQITILKVDQGTRTTAAQISGRDAKLGSGVKATMSMTAVPQDDGVVLKMTTDADISGKIAQYGHGIIKQRATAMTEEFGKCVNEKMGAMVA